MSFLMENWQNSELAAIGMGFGEGLVNIAKKNNLVVALSADLMESVGFGKFYEEIGSPRAIEVWCGGAEFGYRGVWIGGYGKYSVCGQLCGV